MAKLLYWLDLLMGQGSMLKLLNTKTLASLSGMLEDRIRYQAWSLNSSYRINVCQTSSCMQMSCFFFLPVCKEKLILPDSLMHRFDHYGDITFRTLRALYLWWIAMTRKGFQKPEMSFIGCWMRYVITSF